MPSDLSKVAPGYYTADQIRAVAEDSFPDEYNAIPEAEQLPWEAQEDDKATFCEQTLFIGYAKIDGLLWKVSAYMLRSTGEIQFYREGMRMTRSDNGRVQFGMPWAHLRKDGDRPQLEHLQVLCQHYFVAAGFAGGVSVRKGGKWFKTLKRACGIVGEGMGMLAMSVEDGGTAMGVGEGAGVGVVELDVNKTSKILQRLIGFARGRNEHWGKRVEKELQNAWPDMKKYWR